MKKISLVVIVLAMSQLVFAQGFQFGVKGGANISSINDENLVPDAQTDPRLGYHFGVLGHFHLSKNWGLQPEVVYSTEGAKYSYPTYTGKTQINVINIPVLLQFMTGPGFRIETGPQLGFVTKANFEDQNGTRDITEQSKTIVSWALGLGYLTKSGFGIDGRFNLGLTNLYKEDLYPEDVRAKSRVGQIGIFYQFNH